MKVAVCLQTCDRANYTARTLRTFAAQNDLRRFVLLHGDDASKDPAIARLARSYGFQTVVQHTDRRGIVPLRTNLLLAGAAAADWVLLLENDIESIRPFPWTLLNFVATTLPWVYCLRLFGAFKDAERTDACMTVNRWLPSKPVRWKPIAGAPEPAESAVIHWSSQPSVTRSSEVIALQRDGHRELRLKTARVTTNVMVHIGQARTPRPSMEAAC